MYHFCAMRKMCLASVILPYMYHPRSSREHFYAFSVHCRPTMRNETTKIVSELAFHGRVLASVTQFAERSQSVVTYGGRPAVHVMCVCRRYKPERFRGTAIDHCGYLQLVPPLLHTAMHPQCYPVVSGRGVPIIMYQKAYTYMLMLLHWLF